MCTDMYVCVFPALGALCRLFEMDFTSCSSGISSKKKKMLNPDFFSSCESSTHLFLPSPKPFPQFISSVPLLCCFHLVPPLSNPFSLIPFRSSNQSLTQSYFAVTFLLSISSYIFQCSVSTLHFIPPSLLSSLITALRPVT